MITNLHESENFLKQRLSDFKKKLQTERIYYRKIDKDISSLLLEIELPPRKLKTIISLLTIKDYVKNIVQGNEHIALFGKRIQSRILLIGITTKSNPIPPYIFLNISSEPLIFPHKKKLAAYDYQSKKAENTTKKGNI